MKYGKVHFSQCMDVSCKNNDNKTSDVGKLYYDLLRFFLH